MDKIKLENRCKVAVRRALVGDITGLDLKAIIEYQLREYIKENTEPFNHYELGILAVHMANFN